MIASRTVVASLLAGVATGLQAQEPPQTSRSDPQRSTPAQPPAGTTPAQAAPAENAQQPKVEYLGPDRKPLPPEMQRQLEAQFGPAAAPAETDGDITVTGRRPRGSVVSDVPAERTFSPFEIDAYGAGDINELIQALGPPVSSDRGREDAGPVVLLNGKRVSSFAEIAKIPTEAIERMEVFPEEVALAYGFRADQKVVNVVVFERYSSRVGQVAYAVPSEGGRDTATTTANYLRIRGDTRLNFGLEYNRSGSLLENERNVLQGTADAGSGRFRTLLPKTERLGLNATVSGNVLDNVSSSLTGRFDSNDGESLLGLGVSGPLMRDTNTRTAQLGTLLGGQLGRWLWSFTGNYDRTRNTTLTRLTDGPDATDEARSVNSLVNADIVLSGAAIKLPAGPVLISLHGGLETRDFTSRSLRGGVEQSTELSRDSGTTQASVDLPIASWREKSFAWLGDLSANANVKIDKFSDAGTLRTFGYGVVWSPVGGLNFIASVNHEEGAPSLEQLGAPIIKTPNLRIFDFVRRQTVDVAQISGGNPDLRSDDRRVVSFGVNARPFTSIDLTLSIDYVATRIDHPIATFPVAAAEIEAAFPERFARSADGQLLQIDSRPLNYRRSQQKQMRWGVDFSRPLGPLPPGAKDTKVRFVGSEADIQKALPPGAKIIKAEAGSAAAKRFENMASRAFLSLYHTWRLEDDILVREGFPEFDLLNGSAADNRGGRPRHEVELQAGAFRRGLGVRLEANWRSGTVVRNLAAGSGTGGGDLHFSDYMMVNINMFANLADRFGGANAPEWLRGARVSIGINNLFNSRPKVQDEAGSTPLSYQPAYLDPLGRLVNFRLRKVF